MLQWEVYTLLNNSHTAYVSVWYWVKIHQLRLIPSKRMRYPCCLPCELLCFQVRGGCFPSPFQDWPCYFEEDYGHSWPMPYSNRSVTCTYFLFVLFVWGGGLFVVLLSFGFLHFCPRPWEQYTRYKLLCLTGLKIKKIYRIEMTTTKKSQPEDLTTKKYCFKSLKLRGYVLA